MPDVAADSSEGVLAAWLVEESARFDAAQTIAYVETEDELFSVEAGRPGMLLKTLVEPGTTVEPGTPIGVLGEPWEQVHDLDSVLADLGVVRREPVAAAAGLPASPEPAPLRAVRSHVREDETAEGDAGNAGAAGDADRAVEHHYLRTRVRVDRLVFLSARLERERADSSVMDLVARSVAAAHRQVPQLGVARLADDRSATPGIPVSYPGRFGVEEAAPIVPRGQAAALAVGAVRDEPVIDAGSVIPGKVMTPTLSIRPGRVDDVQASRWLAVLVALLERPEWMLD